MATPNARKRALEELMVSPVGQPPAMASKPVDLAALAPPTPEEEYAGYSAGGPLPVDEFTRLQQRAAVGNLVADLGQITAQGIENLTGAKYAPEIYSGMRARASEPLKDYMRLQEQKRGAPLKPTKSTDPKSPESQRAQAIFKQAFPSEDASSITESNLDVAMRTMLGVRGQEGVAGRSAADITQRALDREQRAAEAAAREGRLWSEMSQEERLARLRVEEAKEARETAAATKKEERLEDQTKGFGAAYTEAGFPEFYDQAATAEGLFAKYPGGLPGVGMVEGRVPRRFSGTDAKVLRSTAGQMLLAYKKAVTGLGSSAKEDEAIREATGLIQTGDDESIRLGVGILKKTMDAKLEGLKAGYKPEAVSTVLGRLKSPPKALAPSGGARGPASSAMPKDAAGNLSLENPAAEEKVRMIAPDGRQKLVPKSKVKAAIAAGGRLADG